MVQLNILVATQLISLFLPQLADRKGKILNVASTAAYQAGPKMSVYYASKAYILSLSLALREELKPYGVFVTALCPGGVRTDFRGLDGSNLHKYFPLMPADKVARAGFKGLMKNQAVVIPGFINKFLAFWAQILPKKLIT